MEQSATSPRTPERVRALAARLPLDEPARVPLRAPAPFPADALPLRGAAVSTPELPPLRRPVCGRMGSAVTQRWTASRCLRTLPGSRVRVSSSLLARYSRLSQPPNQTRSGLAVARSRVWEDRVRQETSARCPVRTRCSRWSRGSRPRRQKDTVQPVLLCPLGALQRSLHVDGAVQHQHRHAGTHGRWLSTRRRALV